MPVESTCFCLGSAKDGINPGWSLLLGEARGATPNVYTYLCMSIHLMTIHIFCFGWQFEKIHFCFLFEVVLDTFWPICFFSFKKKCRMISTLFLANRFPRTATPPTAPLTPGVAILRILGALKIDKTWWFTEMISKKHGWPLVGIKGMNPHHNHVLLHPSIPT